MHPIAAIGIETLLRNTQRVRRAIEREQTNPVPPECVVLVDGMRDKWNVDFVNDMVSLVEHVTGKEFPKRESLYNLLRTEPFIVVVQTKNTNGNNYENGIPLVVMDGTSGLMKPTGERGNNIGASIRLATDDEIIGLGHLVGGL